MRRLENDPAKSQSKGLLDLKGSINMDHTVRKTPGEMFNHSQRSLSVGRFVNTKGFSVDPQTYFIDKVLDNDHTKSFNREIIPDLFTANMVKAKREERAIT